MTEHALPGVSDDVGVKSMIGDDPTAQVSAVLAEFNTALQNGDIDKLKSCLSTRAILKDELALTWHMRTLYTPAVIATALLELKELRGITKLTIVDKAIFNDLPGFKYIDAWLEFGTEKPKAECSGRVWLLPFKTQDGVVEWKIHILSTWLRSFNGHVEDESLLSRPRRNLNDDFETDVFIIGGGNAAAALAARLKAQGIDSVMAERNANVGDNWGRRYSFMKFHVPTPFCDMPYKPYPRSKKLLTRDDLAGHLREYVEDLQLNAITSAKVESTQYDPEAKRWTIKFKVGDNPAVRTTISKHLVQATGIGSQEPYVPNLANEKLYKGVSIHSHNYKDPAWLKQQGDVKSVLIIGSANTAFDVLEDLHGAGLDTTMVVRSDTYVVPLEDICHPLCLGAYSDESLTVEACDKNFMTLPNCVVGQLVKMGLTKLALDKPDRYKPLRDVGFPVYDSSGKDASLMNNLIEKCGGHYVDIGGTEILVKKEARVKPSEPVAYTEKGLKFADGSEEEADAIVWCTGYAGKNVRETVANILGGRDSRKDSNVIGPGHVADSVDPTWGIDTEGEIRGMWKRHSKLDNFWVMGGYTQQHRWFSRALSTQIQAELEGTLPPAYLKVPGSN
ncbi:hypothetical protein IWZ01DRAFT_481651 [Phyllosticta capitalensis]